MRKRKNEAAGDVVLLSLISLNEILEEMEKSKLWEDKKMIARRTAREMFDYQTWNEIHKSTLNEIKFKENLINGEIALHDVFMESKNDELSIAMQELERAKKNVAIIEMSLAEAKKFHKKLEAEKSEMAIARDIIQKLNARISKITLIHESAKDMKKTVNDYQLSIMVVNECDFNGYIKDINPDIIVKSTELVDLCVHVPYDFEEKYDEEQRKSIRNYCNLVANVAMKVDDYTRIKLLFSNKDIATILKMNGIGA